ncbi:MAG: sulfotransferase [Gammaproteobacteria bacterium]|nr:sulfotransferase [Gammaproteobacteria bacterium]
MDATHHNKKSVFVILGAARSGTSVLARTLKTLGIHLGDKLLPPGKGNPTGFWEDTDIVYQVNQQLLDQLQFPWDSLKLLDPIYYANESCKVIEDVASQILKNRVQEFSPWGFKDPRTVRVLPFWQSIFKKLELTDQYIIALRNPLCSASSFLGDPTKKGLERGLLLWLMHLVPAIENTHGKKRIIVSYENIMQNPQKELGRLQQFFNLSFPTVNNIEEFTKIFLNQSLDHYRYSYDDLVSHPASNISPLISQCYRLFLKLSNDEISFEDPEFLSTWIEIQREFKNSYPAFCYIDKLILQNKQLERSYRAMQRSPSWKLIYPLRIIEKGLHLLKKYYRAHTTKKLENRLL